MKICTMNGQDSYHKFIIYHVICVLYILLAQHGSTCLILVHFLHFGIIKLYWYLWKCYQRQVNIIEYVVIHLVFHKSFFFFLEHSQRFNFTNQRFIIFSFLVYTNVQKPSTIQAFYFHCYHSYAKKKREP